MKFKYKIGDRLVFVEKNTIYSHSLRDWQLIRIIDMQTIEGANKYEIIVDKYFKKSIDDDRFQKFIYERTLDEYYELEDNIKDYIIYFHQTVNRLKLIGD